MDPELMCGLREEYESLSNDGFRVLAVAMKEMAGKQSCSKDDERELVLRGYVAFSTRLKKARLMRSKPFATMA